MWLLLLVQTGVIEVLALINFIVILEIPPGSLILFIIIERVTSGILRPCLVLLAHGGFLGALILYVKGGDDLPKEQLPFHKFLDDLQVL